MLSNAKNHRTFLKGPLTARPPGLPSPTRSGSAPAGCPGVTSLVFEVAVFKGLPYAATTAGANRWRPPQRAASWTGVRVADTFGDICPQQLRGSASVTMSEDCLHLNGWTGAASSREKRPVLVRIYGGRFTGGYASDPGFDGAGLAAKGVVVVTLNYRTGVFGFLSAPELSAESGHQASGNYGLLDQISALRWLGRNISAFGDQLRLTTTSTPRTCPGPTRTARSPTPCPTTW